MADAFDEVQRAEQDEDRFVEEANQYSNQKLGQARGEASQVREDAAAYKNRVAQEAEGEAKRFLSVYNEYVKAPDVTRKRLFIETMEKVLQGSNKVIVEQGSGQGVLPYLPLPELEKRKPAADRREQLMTNRLPIIGVVVAVVLFLIYSSVFVVNQREQAIVLRFGEIVDVKSEPGIYFKAPFSFFDADTVQIIENRLLRFDLDNIRVQVSGGKFYEVDAFLVYRISDPAAVPRGGVGPGDAGRAAAPDPPRRRAAPRLRLARLRIGAVRGARRHDARGARPAAAGRQLARRRDRRRAHPPHRPDGGSLAADLRSHEGRAPGRSRAAAGARPRGGAGHPRQGRPRGGRDDRRGAQGIGDPARRGRSRAQRAPLRRPSRRTPNSSSSTGR